MKNGDKKVDERLLAITAEKEQKDRQLLSLEWVLGLLGLASFLSSVLMCIPVSETNVPIAVTMFVVGFVIFVVAAFFSLKIEQIAGYYQCAKCSHKHVPTFKAVFLAMHLGRTRHLRCPKCGKKSWQKKVL